MFKQACFGVESRKLRHENKVVYGIQAKTDGIKIIVLG